MIRIISTIIMVLGLFSAPAMAAVSQNSASSDNGIMALLAGVMVTAQPDFGQPCARSSECGSGESCVNGICQTSYGGSGCVGDYQCPTGERCNNGTCK
jgi:hypothetical protein